MTNLHIGTILIAKEDFGEFTKGKEYPIVENNNDITYRVICNDEKSINWFDERRINQHFTIKRYTLSDLQERTDIMVRIENEEQAKKLKDAGIKFPYHKNHSFYGYEGRLQCFVWLDEKQQQGRILLSSIDEIDLGDDGKICKYCNAKLSKNEIEDNCYANPNNASKVINEDIKVADYIYELESQIARLNGEVEQLIEEKRILISQLKESYGIDRQSTDLTKRERMAWEIWLQGRYTVEQAIEKVNKFLEETKEVGNG